MPDARSDGVHTPEPHQPAQPCQAISTRDFAGLTIAAIALAVWAAQLRVSRRRARNEAHLAERHYTRGYMDGLQDRVRADW